jgi:hypothetical protein
MKINFGEVIIANGDYRAGRCNDADAQAAAARAKFSEEGLRTR